VTPRPSVRSPRWRWTPAGLVAGERVLAAETAVALAYDGATHAVMMATPDDLEDFATGFSLSEGLADTPDDIIDLEIADCDLDIELRMRLTERCGLRHAARRRHLAGPVGCGLCGIQSLAEAVRPVVPVAGRTRIAAGALMSAMAALPHAQRLNQEVRAVHAAAFWRQGDGIVAVREDVGRHNALDKLAGALARRRVAADGGAVLLSSRVSVEMVQKAARLGAPVLVAVSAPTALAVRTAEGCGVTLVGVAREDGFEVFSHPERIAATPAVPRSPLGAA
jgi:FdhD protein